MSEAPLETPPLELTMLAEAREDVIKADQKASIVLASLGIGTAAVVAGIVANDWHPPQANHFPGVVWWIGVAVMAAATTCAGLAVWPRYDASDGSDGIYYWAHIASFESLVAFTAALDASPPDSRERTRNQLWAISRIVAKKYLFVRWAMGLAAGSVALTSIGLIAHAVTS